MAVHTQNCLVFLYVLHYAVRAVLAEQRHIFNKTHIGIRSVVALLDDCFIQHHTAIHPACEQTTINNAKGQCNVMVPIPHYSL